MSDGTVMNMIQTDCTINSGNSGGPLFDQYGRVVGITSAKLSSSSSDTTTATIEGMGFAIPINDVIDIITDYMQYGYVTGRPYMGITVRTVETDYQQAFGWPAGVYVNTVEDGSCAQTAGLKVGDIITKVGDTDVTSMAELSSAKNTYKAGETTTLTVYRSGETITLTITFDEQVNNTQTTTTDASDDTADSSVQDPNAQETASTGDNYGGSYGGGSNGYGYGYGSNGGSSFPWGYGG
jgi:serine protease Do